MRDEEARQRIAYLRTLIERFGLATLKPLLQACESLAPGTDALLDIAVFGQFKSGKSSLLNAVVGNDVLPVGVLPVTMVVTRLSAGPMLAVRVTRLDGSVEEVEPTAIADFVAESRNPNNRRSVAIVDVLTPALSELPGLRLVDTPGLGSVLAHNTQSTREWLPNVAVALVAVSAERPLSDEDRQLIAELRPHAPRVCVVLTKVDLLTEAQRQEVREFVSDRLASDARSDVPVLFFSTREQPERWVQALKEQLLRPLAIDARNERERTLAHKLDSLTKACRGYLSVALQAAERAESDRERLAAAALNESVKEPVIRDELDLASQRLARLCRPTFEKLMLGQRSEIERRLLDAITAQSTTWHGNLADQTVQYRDWMLEHLTAELEPVSRQTVPLAYDLLTQAEERFRRVVEAFSDRLSRSVSQATGVTLSPVTWEVKRPPLLPPPVMVSPAFMTNWELLAWLIPMSAVGGIFRRHIASRVPREVEKNLIRLTSEWSEATGLAIGDLNNQAVTWVVGELAMLRNVLAQRPEQISEIRAALSSLD